MRTYSIDLREKIVASVKLGIPERQVAYTTPSSEGRDHGACKRHQQGTCRTHSAHGGSRLGPYTRGYTRLPHACSACGGLHADGSVRRRTDAWLRRIE